MDVEDITPEILAHEKALNCEILKVVRHEEEFLRIKSLQLWLKGGDKNTIYFHKQTKFRLSFNFINELKNNNNQIISGKTISRSWLCITSISCILTVVRWILSPKRI